MTLLPRALSLCHTLLSSYNETTVPTLDVSDCPSNSNTRTLWDIILGCALTLFACTWTAVHPNIPGMEEGIITITSRRLFLMVMALIAPELMITWSARQFLSARDTAKYFKILGKELQAAQANGDGRKSGEEDTTMSPVVDPPLHKEEPQVAEAIGDGHNAGEEDTVKLLPKCPQSHERNSTDPNSPRAQGVQFLGWTLTHGFFAWMGGFLLYENNKPRATLTPGELIELIRNKSVDMPIIAEEDIKDRSKEDVLSKGIAISQLAWFIVELAARYSQSLPISLLEIDTLAVASLTCIAYGLWWKKPKDVGRPYIVHLKATASRPSCLAYEGLSDNSMDTYFWYSLHPFFSLMGLGSEVSPSAVRSYRALSLGGYTKTRNGIVLLIGCISGMLFASIHCMGWTFLFQWQMAWRVASLSMLCIAVGILIMFGPDIFGVRSDFLAIFRGITMIIFIIVYGIARIGLIVLMLMSLRSLPPGTYDTVAWTKYLPHYL